MLYITFLVLTYFITGSLYLWTTFIQFPIPPPPTSVNHKSDLLFYEFVCFWSIIDLQHCVSSWCTTQWFRYFYTFQNGQHSYLLSPYKDITLLSATFTFLYVLYLWFVYFVMEFLYIVIYLTYLSHFPTPFPSSNHMFILCIYNSVAILCLFIGFVLWIPCMSEIIQCLSFSVWLTSPSITQVCPCFCK